jgi:L-aminopeptidase/D-esterase-like protein
MNTPPNVTLTALSGLLVGHAQHPGRPTGCTVVLCPQGVVAGIDVRGAAPGTRETDALQPGHTVPHVHAIVLSGGSAYGLEAASGVMRWLEHHGHGLSVGPARVPIVPAAVIFDLTVGDASMRPDAPIGWAACENASTQPVVAGNVGAGAGATVGKVFGPELAMRGGLGSALITVGPWQVGALMVCNALGDVVEPETGAIVAGARTSPQSLTPLNTTQALLRGQQPKDLMAGTHTTIGVVACNALLDKAQAQRLAVAGHDGLARTIRPVHTPMDGDTLFGLATGTCELPPDLMLLGTMAAEAVAQATLQAVRSASGLRWGERWWPAASDLSHRRD